MAEDGELDYVAPEEERHRPVEDDAELPRYERELVQVVRPRDPPPGEPAQAHSGDLGDALVVPERRDLAEHAVAVRLGRSRQILGEPARPPHPGPARRGGGE